MNLSKLVPTLAGLVSDPNEHVREAAVCALVEIYRNVGERVRRDITRLDSKQGAQLPVLPDPARVALTLHPPPPPHHSHPFQQA